VCPPGPHTVIYVFSYLRLPQRTILKNGLICMLDIRAYVILLIDFPLCLVIVAKNEINSLLPSGGNYCCYTWTDKLLLRYGGKCCCYAWTGKLLLRSGGKCCCYAWNDKLRPGRIGQLGQTGKNQTQCPTCPNSDMILLRDSIPQRSQPATQENSSSTSSLTIHGNPSRRFAKHRLSWTIVERRSYLP
jgi:hypothetical protein